MLVLQKWLCSSVSFLCGDIESQPSSAALSEACAVSLCLLSPADHLWTRHCSSSSYNYPKQTGSGAFRELSLSLFAWWDVKVLQLLFFLSSLRHLVRTAAEAGFFLFSLWGRRRSKLKPRRSEGGPRRSIRPIRSLFHPSLPPTDTLYFSGLIYPICTVASCNWLQVQSRAEIVHSSSAIFSLVSPQKTPQKVFFFCFHFEWPAAVFITSRSESLTRARAPSSRDIYIRLVCNISPYNHVSYSPLSSAITQVFYPAFMPVIITTLSCRGH